MHYSHESIKVEETAPGHFRINNLPHAQTLTEAGHVVAPSDVVIGPNMPSDLLLAIVEARGDSPVNFASELEGVSGELEQMRHENMQLREKAEALKKSEEQNLKLGQRVKELEDAAHAHKKGGK